MHLFCFQTARCTKTITQNKTKGEQKKEAKSSVPASRVPQSRLSGAPASQKPQNAPSELLRKRPLHVLPSKASAESLTRKQRTTISSSKHGLCQARKTKKLELVTEPKTQALQQTAKSFTHPNHPVESSQEKADKENLGSKLNPSLEKEAARRLPSGPQTLNSRPNVGFASQGSLPVKRQAQTYPATKLQVQHNPRRPSANLKGADLQKQVPGASGAQIALKAVQSSICSRPEIKSRGLNPRATKPCTRVLRQQKENAAKSRTCRAPDPLQGGQLKQQQATPCKAQHGRRHSSNLRALTNPSVTESRGKPALPLAAPDDIDKHRSTARRSRNSMKLQRVPKTPGLKSRPVISPGHTANRVTGTVRCERRRSRQLGMGQEPQTPCTQDRRQVWPQVCLHSPVWSSLRRLS